MKRNSKKWGMLLLTATIQLMLSACSTEQSNLQVLEELDTQPEYLSFFSSENMSGSDVTKYWSDRFTELYNKKVYINFDGAAYYADEGLSYRELLEKRLESSAPDDLYIIQAEDVLEFEKKGYWMDLSDMEFVNNLSEAALYQSTYQGMVFSIPLSFTGFGFVWNVDLLEEHSLSVPQNLGEFLAVCGKLKTDGILAYGANKGYALTVPAMCAGLSELYGADQEEITASLNSGETAISTYMRKGFEFLAYMIEKGYLDANQALSATPRIDDIELFSAGKCAFICSDLGGIDVENLAFQTEMTGLPLLADGCIAVYGADSRLCANPNSQHLDTVKKFIEMVGTPEALAKTAAMSSSMSSAKDIEIAGYPSQQKLIALLQEPAQIPNQDFALHFNTWISIRDVSREICSGASVEQACLMLDEKQSLDLEAYRAD